MSPPEVKIPVDPALQAETEAANAQKQAALQERLKGDTAKILARYGSTMALSGAKIGSPVPSASQSGGGYMGGVTASMGRVL